MKRRLHRPLLVVAALAVLLTTATLRPLWAELGAVGTVELSFTAIAVLLAVVGGGTVCNLWVVSRATRLARRRGLAEREAREQANRLADLMNLAPCGYHSLDPEGVIQEINDTELDWLGYQRSEVIGKLRLVDVVTPAGRATFRAAFSTLMQSGSVREVEYDMLTKSGETFPVLVSATAARAPDGTFLSTRSIVFQIRERRRLERKLERAIQDAEERIRDLERQTLEAERATQMKITFMSRVSRELRDSVAIVKGFAELLEDEVSGAINTDQKQHLVRIRDAGNRLLRVVDDVLDLSRLEAGAVELRPHELRVRDILFEAAHRARGVAQQQDVTIEILAEDVGVLADPVRLRQMLYHLLTDLLYTATAGEQVVLEAVQTGDHCYIALCGGGQRIAGAPMRLGRAEATRAAAFGSFSSLHAVTHKIQESDLAISIARALVTLQGGDLWLENFGESHTRVCFTLPVARPRAVSVTAVSSQPHESNGCQARGA